MCFCDALSREWVDSLAEEPNLISTRYLRVGLRFDTFAHKRNIDEKSFQKRFLRESHDRFFAKAPFFEFGGLKMVPKTSPGRLGRPLGAHLGALGSLLGVSWGALGGLLGDLGRSWGALGGLLDGSERPLGGS